MISFKQPLEKR